MAALKQKLFLMAFGLLLPLVLLVLMEGLLALLGMGEEARDRDPFVGFARGSRLFEEREVDGERRYVTRPAKLAFFNEQSFPVEKGADAYRIFTLGGSTTAGRPYDARASFSNWLRLYLEAAEPGRRWEVVNAGAVSYASYRVTLLMRELVEYEPDLFIVYTGHNEYLEKRSYEAILRQPQALRRLRQWLSGFRVAAVLGQALKGREDAGDAEGKVMLASEVEARLDGWTGLDAYQRDEELARGIEEHFRFNLHRMVELARDAGARIVFVQPASNLKDFSPFKSQSGRDAGPEAVGRARALRQRAHRALGRGDPEGALGAAREAVELDPLFAEGWFLLGRAKFELGDFQGAREDLVRAKELDVAPLRSLESLVAEVDAVAAAEGAPVLDLPAYLGSLARERYGHGVLGSEFFQDHVHPSMEVHSRVALELMRILEREGVVAAGRTVGEEERQRIFRREVADLDPVYYAHRDMNLGKVLGWSGKLGEAEAPLRRAAEVLTEEADVFLNLGILLANTGRPGEAVPVLEKARELDPSSPAAEFNLGVAYGKLGLLEEGVAALRSALARRPDWAEARFNLGSLLRRQGDLDAAEAELREALALRRSGGEIVVALASLLEERGEVPAAQRLLRSHLGESSWVAGHLALARILAEEGRADEALIEIRAALTLDPASAEALYRQGLIFAKGGQGEAAEGAYRKALEVDPGHARAANNLALQRAAAGDLQAASELLLQAIEADPGYAEGFFNLGVVYDQAGAPREALRAIEKALELDPENARFLEAQGMLRRALGIG